MEILKSGRQRERQAEIMGWKKASDLIVVATKDNMAMSERRREGRRRLWECADNGQDIVRSGCGRKGRVNGDGGYAKRMEE